MSERVIEPTPYAFPPSDDFKESERHFLGHLFVIPNIEFIEGWLYGIFKKRYNQSLNYIDQSGKHHYHENEFKKKTYELSGDEESFINEGGLENDINELFNSFHFCLRKYHLFFKNRNDLDLVKSFYRCIYYLNGHDSFSIYKEGEVIENNLNWNVLLNPIKRNTDELIKELDWRINRLNPNNYHNYNPNDKELERYFDFIVHETIKLYSKKSFDLNVGEIHKELVPLFFHENTSVEDLHLLFSGKSEILSSPLVWVSNANSLSYFLRKLHENNKLMKSNYFQIAEKLIADEQLSLFKSLKNNRSIPNNASDLDKIVELF
ncbi:hypothetical protein [Flagellimonas sp.]|uniref:hypothetical protein n=1 Tax=Flagellimonas sp. TaxID=2058762 RepID=UPI003AB6384B